MLVFVVYVLIIFIYRCLGYLLHSLPRYLFCIKRLRNTVCKSIFDWQFYFYLDSQIFITIRIFLFNSVLSACVGYFILYFLYFYIKKKPPFYVSYEKSCASKSLYKAARLFCTWKTLRALLTCNQVKKRKKSLAWVELVVVFFSLVQTWESVFFFFNFIHNCACARDRDCAKMRRAKYKYTYNNARVYLRFTRFSV